MQDRAAEAKENPEEGAATADERMERPAPPSGASVETPARSGRRLRLLLEVVELLYEAAESADRFDSALSLLCTLLDADSILLLSNDDGQQRIVAAGRRPTPSARTSAPRLSSSERTRTVPLVGGLQLVLDTPHADLAPFTTVSWLAPHLARAVRVSERLHLADHGKQERSVLLDRLPLGVVLLNDDHRVVFATRIARSLLARCASLDMTDGRLRPRDGVSKALFATLLESVSNRRDGERRFVGGRIALHDTELGTVNLSVAPYSFHVDRRPVSVAVILWAKGVAPSPDERLAEVFGLSPDAARVAGHLVAGRNPALDEDRPILEAALASLFRTLGTTRQAELLRLLLRPPGVVLPPGPSQEA